MLSRSAVSNLWLNPNIEMSGFHNWVSNAHIYDDRITTEMINQLKEWAKNNNLLNLQNIIDNHAKRKRLPK